MSKAKKKTAAKAKEPKKKKELESQPKGSYDATNIQVLEGAGHAPFISQPEMFAGLIDKLASQK